MRVYFLEDQQRNLLIGDSRSENCQCAGGGDGQEGLNCARFFVGLFVQSVKKRAKFLDPRCARA